MRFLGEYEYKSLRKKYEVNVVEPHLTRLKEIIDVRVSAFESREDDFWAGLLEFQRKQDIRNFGLAENAYGSFSDPHTSVQRVKTQLRPIQ